MLTRRSLLVATFPLPWAGILTAQRRLGPKDRATILDARLDPGFTSTPLSRLIFLPFSNELDYPDGAMMLAEIFIAGMRQRHPDISIIPPEDAKGLVRDHKLGEDYRRFLGNYMTSGVATMPFLQALGRIAGVDGVLMGRILSFGVVGETREFAGVRWSKNRAVVGMELTLFRAKDGRELWWGTHGVQGEKNETVRDLAKVVGEVFAAYFGRLPY
jgi:hypothetical protein